MLLMLLEKIVSLEKTNNIEQAFLNLEICSLLSNQITNDNILILVLSLLIIKKLSGSTTYKIL